jgi:hypothetical protein
LPWRISIVSSPESHAGFRDRVDQATVVVLDHRGPEVDPATPGRAQREPGEIFPRSGAVGFGGDPLVEGPTGHPGALVPDALIGQGVE